jgi:hypothetical protein
MSTTTTPPKDAKGLAAQRYWAYAFEREPFLIRARRLSRLTISALFRELGENETTSETLPWNSLGAYCVDCLVGKLAKALFPAGIPFITLKQSKQTLNGYAQLVANGTLTQDAVGKLKVLADKALSGVEQEFIDGVEEDGDRAHLFDALRHLVVGGNHAIQVMRDASLKTYPLEQYVTSRDGQGNLVEAIINEPLAWDTLEPDIQAACEEHGYKMVMESEDPTTPRPIQAPVHVFTHIRRLHSGSVSPQYKVYQECWGFIVPGSTMIYDGDAMPFLFLRMIALKKENYGRSYCEPYEADLQTVDGYEQLLLEAGAALAQLKWLVKPGGVTNKKAFAELPNGGVMTGDVEDVSAARADKAGDIEVASQQQDKIIARLERVFIINSSVQRNGERVTAEEIRYLAQELENTLGGVYSNQVTTFQTPYAALKLKALQRNKRVTPLPKGAVNMTILTGDAALGRQQKAQTLDEWIQTSFQITTAAAQSPLAAYFQWDNYLARGAANRAIDSDGLLFTQDEVDAKQQQAQQQAMLSQVAPEAVRQGGQMIQNQQQASLAAPSAQGQPAPSPTQQPAQSAA